MHSGPAGRGNKEARKKGGGEGEKLKVRLRLTVLNRRCIRCRPRFSLASSFSGVARRKKGNGFSNRYLSRCRLTLSHHQLLRGSSCLRSLAQGFVATHRPFLSQEKKCHIRDLDFKTKMNGMLRLSSSKEPLIYF